MWCATHWSRQSLRPTRPVTPELMPDLILCNIEDARWVSAELENLANRAARATLSDRQLDPARFEISLLGCGDARIAVLNGNFRNKSAPTNVLSWPSYNLAAVTAGQSPCAPIVAPADRVTELGDIAISYDTCVREATEAGKPLSDHITHLIAHAVLHLLGYDHIRDKDATLMEMTEVAILGKLGIDNPY